MTYTYTGNLSDTTEAIRLRIGDTGGTAATSIFADEEIDYFYTEAGTVVGAAIMALRTIVASRVLLARKAKLEGYEIEEYSIADIQKAIDVLEEEATNGGIEVGRLATTGEHLDSYRPSWIPDEDTGIGLTY